LAIEYHPPTSETPANLKVILNKDLIRGAGRNAVSNLLLRLQIYRATADIENGQPWFETLAQVDGDYLLWQEAVEKHHETRPIFVQANTILNGEDQTTEEGTAPSGRKVLVQEYPPTREGVIRSWVDRCILCDI